jgi:hypothetical protein
LAFAPSEIKILKKNKKQLAFALSEIKIRKNFSLLSFLK